MTGRVLNAQELNRALLARQHLLERSRAPLARTVERIGGIQAQYAPSIYIGLWSRVAGLERAAVTRALRRRTLVQATSLRGTIHVVTPGDHWPFADVARERMQALWLTTRRDLDPAAMADAGAILAPRLAEGPVTRREMEDLLGRDRAAGVGFWTDLVRVPPSGTWEHRRADLYAATEDWIGPRPALGRDEVLALVAGRYLRGFGPATARDVASWAGVLIGTITPVLRAMDLRRFRDEQGAELHDVPRAPLPPADTPAPVRLLPTWDATLLVHARRTGVLPEEHRTRIFSSRVPHSFPTFLVDGAVAGTWSVEGGRFTATPFGALAPADRDALEEEGARMAAFVA